VIERLTGFSDMYCYDERRSDPKNKENKHYGVTGKIRQMEENSRKDQRLASTDCTSLSPLLASARV
jgi:hypothetical protein